jgi:hypothetical protein
MNSTGYAGDFPTKAATSPAPLGNGFSGVVAAHVSDLDAEQLARMTAASYYWASPGWLAAAERLPGHHFIHLAVKDASGRIIGLLPCQYVTDNSTPGFYDIARMIAESANSPRPRPSSVPATCTPPWWRPHPTRVARSPSSRH